MDHQVVWAAQFGANGGFTSRIVYNRSDGVTVILLANGNGGTLGTMAEGVRRIVVGPPSGGVR